ncbi:MAG: HD-GYP domain-containing protein [Acidimicrobiales bacterium]
MKHLDRVNHGVLAAFGRQIAAHDEALGPHSARVASLAVGLGGELGLDGPALNSLRWAGQLHDLGKTTLATPLLMKTGPLDEVEWTELEKHPIVGYDLVIEASPESHDLALAIRSHHERWDGLGYPHNLRGEEIPHFGRIVAIADVYDALTSDRPYRSRPYAHGAAVDLIAAESESHFDPAVVEAFLALERRGMMGSDPASGPDSAEAHRTISA